MGLSLAPRPRASIPAQPLSALIIDDDDLVRRALARGLRRHYAVTEASSCEAALALLAAGARFDAIVCDLNLSGMSGSELVFALHDRGDEHVERMVILSGSSREMLPDDVVELLHGRILEKPATIGEIVATMGTIAGRQARAA